MLEAEVTDVVFSCPGIVEITYDLNVCGSVNISLSYSPDKCTWVEVSSGTIGVTGAIGLQTSGTNKKITWNAADFSANFGKLYFKVEYPAPPDLNPNPTPVTINGVKWAPVNLDVGGVFCTNPYDYGGLYQWGRVADGHECPTSPTTTTLSPSAQPGHGVFILAPNTPYDWLASPDGFHWNVDENSPLKTANDPCPDGWRVPTFTELETLGIPLTNQTLVTKVWTTQNGINGYLCTDNNNGNSIFLPAAGNRFSRDGSLLYTDTNGYYWSSTPPNSTLANSLNGYSGFFNRYAANRAYGMSVRCVSEL